MILSNTRNPSLYNLTTSHSYIICIKGKKVLTIKIINWGVPDPSLNAVVYFYFLRVCIDICNLFLERVFMGSQMIFHMGHKTKFEKSCCRNQIQRKLLWGEWLCFGKTISCRSCAFILCFSKLRSAMLMLVSAVQWSKSTVSIYTPPLCPPNIPPLQVTTETELCFLCYAAANC